MRTDWRSSSGTSPPACRPPTKSTDANGVKYKPHDIAPADMLFDRTRAENQGYVTNALEGLWARAPYLHNGAVPDRLPRVGAGVAAGRHSCAASCPTTRRIVGFDWEPAQLAAYRAAYPTAATFDTAWDGASRFGHDTNLTIDKTGHIIKKGWDGDRARRRTASAPGLVRHGEPGGTRRAPGIPEDLIGVPNGATPHSKSARSTRPRARAR